MIGDRSYFRDMVMANLPLGWFDPEGEVVNALADAMAEPQAAMFDLAAYVSQQSRLATATDSFLDLLTVDYFGPAFMQRRKGEGDDLYRARLQAEMLRPLGTRPAITDLVDDLTGNPPVIFEHNNAADAACWGFMGYGTGARYGSQNRPFEYLIDVTRPAGQGIPDRQGWGHGGYGNGNFAYASRADIEGVVTDDEIMASIARATPAGVKAFVRISS